MRNDFITPDEIKNISSGLHYNAFKKYKIFNSVLMVMDLLFVATDGRMPSQNDMDVVFGAENNKSISVNAIFETTPVFSQAHFEFEEKPPDINTPSGYFVMTNHDKIILQSLPEIRSFNTV
jgi:hypothetical protein